MQVEQSIVDDVDGITGVWEYLNTEGRNKLNADTTPNSNLHIRKSDDHWYCSRFKDCHPQTLKSGISIEVLGDNETSVRVRINVDEEYRVNVLDNVKFTDIFPDVNFCRAVLNNLKKKDGITRANVDDIMTLRDWATLSAIDDLQIEGYGIKDLTGIEYFPFLDWLVCNDNEITKLTPKQVPNMIFVL